MAIIERMLFKAAVKVAKNPRVQAKALEVFEDKIKPRAEQAWKKAKPQLEATLHEVREAAEDIDPGEDPQGFATRVRQRLDDVRTGRKKLAP